MEFEELKQKSNLKVLLRGKSGRGKTRKAAKYALAVSKEGGDVLYVDTEAEGSTTLVSLIEDGPFDESDVRNIEYTQAGSYDEFTDAIKQENQENYDLIVVDTLDHKHTYVLRAVTGKKLEANADWNEYPVIYSKEKELMEMLATPKCNIIATLDPESGKMDKPKGAQTNVHGYFTAVLDLNKSGGEWSHVVRNYVGKSKAIGNTVSNIDDAIIDDLTDRIEQ